MDLIISLNLQLRLGVDLKDWNVKEIIFWCELICGWGNWKVLVLFRKTKEWFHLCGVRRILGQIFKDQTLYPKHVRTDDFLRSLDDLSVISNFSTTLGFSGIVSSRGAWVSLILKFMKMKTTPKILLYSDVEYNPWLFLSKWVFRLWKVKHFSVNWLHSRSRIFKVLNWEQWTVFCSYILTVCLEKIGLTFNGPKYNISH